MEGKVCRIIKKGKTGTPIGEPCASCGVKCCNRFAVPLTGFDVARIIDATGVGAQDFCRLERADLIGEAPHSKIFIFVGGRIEERLLALKRRKNEYCVFSLHSEGCAVWGAHPYACKAYPFELDENGKIRYGDNFVCPRKWESGEFDVKKVSEIVRGMRGEIEEYNKIVRKWNAQFAKEGDEKKFFSYLLKESRTQMDGPEK